MMIASVTRLLSYVIHWSICPPSSLSSTGHCKPLSQSPAFSPLKDGREQHSPGNFWSDPAFNVVLIEARVGILIIADDQQAVFPPYWQRHHPPGGAGPAIYSLTRKQNIPPKEPSKSTLPRKLLHDSSFPYMSLRNGILKIWRWKCTGD